MTRELDPAAVLVDYAKDLGSCETVDAVLQHLGDRCTELLGVDIPLLRELLRLGHDPHADLAQDAAALK